MKKLLIQVKPKQSVRIVIENLSLKYGVEDEMIVEIVGEVGKTRRRLALVMLNALIVQVMD
jgi:hypothetical protein